MVGKLIVGFAHQEENIRGLHAHAERLSDHGDFFPYARTEILSGEEARALQPDLSRDITLALHSLDSGIVDSHSLMQSFEKEIKDSDETHIAYRTEAVRVDPQTGGWVVQTASRGTGTEETTSLLARTLINASGLSCNLVLNSLFKNRSDRISLAFAKGSYAGYRGPGVSQVSKLIYPVPTAERGSHSHQSLGTHLTLDIAGNIRFGPDLEWLMPDSSNEDDQADFWQSHLRPDELGDRLSTIHSAAQKYLPGIILDGLRADYSGIRPKLQMSQTEFQDFVIQRAHSDSFIQSGHHSGAPMISLLGIESPGLTACLAIAEYVVDMIYPDNTTGSGIPWPYTGYPM